MRRTLIMTAALAVVALWAGLAMAGEWHAGTKLVCYDCHTAHHSMQHGWAGGPVGNTPQAGGDWMGAGGPYPLLLKLPANELCMTCHDNTNTAPDVVGTFTGTVGSQGRSAGALNKAGQTYQGYPEWTGHSLGATTQPPGWNPTAVGLAANFWDFAQGLTCISCHSGHGNALRYRNMSSRFIPTAGDKTGARAPTYVVSTTNDTTKDVWINLDPTAALADIGNRTAPFGEYYSSAYVFYNKRPNYPAGGGALITSNALGQVCAGCHADFHGDTPNTNISDGTDYLRHPTAGVEMNSSSHYWTGTGGTSTAPKPTTRVKVYSNNYSDLTAAPATPGCVSCHKAHGNKNPFGLIFLGQYANPADVTEEGAFGTDPTGTPQPIVGPNGAGTGLRSLCGQCHGQGN